MDEMRQLVEKLGGKRQAAAKLMISVAYVDMIISGKRRPSRRLVQLMRIYLI